MRCSTGEVSGARDGPSGAMPAAGPFPGAWAGTVEDVLPTNVCDSDQNGRILKSDYSGRSLRALPFRQSMGVRRLSVLSELKIGESGVLVALDLPESVQNHLMHMGFVPDALRNCAAPRSGGRPHRLRHRRHGDRSAASKRQRPSGCERLKGWPEGSGSSLKIADEQEPAEAAR